MSDACLTCGKINSSLKRCGRCKSAWFCNRECQAVACKELGHRGANCRAAEEVAVARTPAPARTQAAPAEFDGLVRRYTDLMKEADRMQMTSSRVSCLAAVEKLKAASTVADLVGGGHGAFFRSDADGTLSRVLFHLGDTKAAAHPACSSLQAARLAGDRTMVVKGLATCGLVAQVAPSEMLKAEKEIREQERLSGSPPSFGGLDLSQEGRISLPTTPAALARLWHAYYAAAVSICDAARAAARDRGTPLADENVRLPSLSVEAQARGNLGSCLHQLGVERQRSLELHWQGVALRRRVLQTAVSDDEVKCAKRLLAIDLSNLADTDTTQALACLREALELSEDTDSVKLKQVVLTRLANLSCKPDQPVKPAEAAAFRSRLN